MGAEQASPANNGVTIPPEDLQGFLLREYQQELLSTLEAPDPEGTYPFQVDYLSLGEHSPAAAQRMQTEPQEALKDLESALTGAQHKLLRAQPQQQQPRLSVKEAVRVRLTGTLFLLHGAHSPTIAQLRARHVGRLVAVEGTVIRAGAAQVLEAERRYECSRCGHQFTVEVDIESGATAQLPAACPSGRVRPCKGASFRHVAEAQRHSDFQEIRVQERGESVAAGASPAAVNVIVQDDLVDTCQPGDDVIVVAAVTQQWRSCYVGARCEVDLALLANNLTLSSARETAVEVSEESAAAFERFWEEHAGSRLAGRDRILGCLCPQIHGMPAVKLATLLALVGGLRRIGESGMRVRGEVHVLLVGDPGTGKSQFLKYAARLCPRSIMTSGKGSSAAGLTATAVKEGQHWGLEAGAMVLADGGLCCIDEIDGLGESARAAIHEAMEQQTVSVAKAGLLTTLNSRTTVFGAANPRGAFDPRESLSTNTSLSGPLLSRFDVLMVLRDAKLSQWDEAVADHVLGGHKSGLAPSLGWDVDRLQQYICWAKAFEPSMTPPAEALLLCYYQTQRQSPTSEPARTTIRMLESLARLAQAHARLLARREVTQQDAAVAVLLVDASMGTSALVGLNPVLDSALGGPEAADLEGRLLSLLGDRLLLCA